MVYDKSYFLDVVAWLRKEGRNVAHLFELYRAPFVPRNNASLLGRACVCFRLNVMKCSDINPLVPWLFAGAVLFVVGVLGVRPRPRQRWTTRDSVVAEGRFTLEWAHSSGIGSGSPGSDARSSSQEIYTSARFLLRGRGWDSERAASIVSKHHMGDWRERVQLN